MRGEEGGAKAWMAMKVEANRSKGSVEFFLIIGLWLVRDGRYGVRRVVVVGCLAAWFATLTVFRHQHYLSLGTLHHMCRYIMLDIFYLKVRFQTSIIQKTQWSSTSSSNTKTKFAACYPRLTARLRSGERKRSTEER